MVIAFCALFAVPSCASEPLFPYRHYGLQAESYEGVLLADKAENDLPLARCTPIINGESDPGAEPMVEYQCVVILKDEFFKLRADHLKLQSELQACQDGK